MCVLLCISIVDFEIFQVSTDDCSAAFMSCHSPPLSRRALTFAIIPKTPFVMTKFLALPSLAFDVLHYTTQMSGNVTRKFWADAVSRPFR